MSDNTTLSFTIEDIKERKKKADKKTKIIAATKQATKQLISKSKDMITKIIEIIDEKTQPARDTGTSLFIALQGEFRTDVFQILKSTADIVVENFKGTSDKWLETIVDHIDENEEDYKRIMMQRAGLVIKKLVGLADPIQLALMNEDQLTELAIDASVKIPSAIIIAALTSYAKSLPLMIKLTGLVPPATIEHFESVLDAITCIFNNLRKFQNVIENEETSWKGFKTLGEGKIEFQDWSCGLNSSGKITGDAGDDGRKVDLDKVYNPESSKRFSHKRINERTEKKKKAEDEKKTAKAQRDAARKEEEKQLRAAAREAENKQAKMTDQERIAKADMLSSGRQKIRESKRDKTTPTSGGNRRTKKKHHKKRTR